jgi:hypothetical protein
MSEQQTEMELMCEAIIFTYNEDFTWTYLFGVTRNHKGL